MSGSEGPRFIRNAEHPFDTGINPLRFLPVLNLPVPGIADDLPLLILLRTIWFGIHRRSQAERRHSAEPYNIGARNPSHPGGTNTCLLG